MTMRFAEKRKRGEKQRTLDEARVPTGRGGWRPGAGRKKTGAWIGPMHRKRAEITADKPLHVRLRMHPAVGRLRRHRVYHVIRQVLARMLGRGDYRVVHVSIQHNHVHLLVEAESKQALARGTQALCISRSRRLNRVLGRSGPVILCR